MASDTRRGPSYFGTGEEVRLGDRVGWRTLLIFKTEGVVCYVPGVSPRHRDMEYSGFRHVGVRLPDGDVRQLLWAACESSLEKGVTLLGRGHPYEPLCPDVQLDETNQAWGKTGADGEDS